MNPRKSVLVCAALQKRREREAARMNDMAEAFEVAALMVEKGWSADDLRLMAWMCRK